MPNPFSMATSIRFDVPSSSGRVGVQVFDVADRRVRSLFSGTPDPGTYEATWDGRSDAGILLSSGAYFVVLKAPGQRKEAKLVFLR